ncbi:hypothetical protein J1614_003205 [Plenodomus biglobosus]|nr:hypothetical protein J1614_003205 [Plenodomus biglobosus]
MDGVAESPEGIIEWKWLTQILSFPGGWDTRKYTPRTKQLSFLFGPEPNALEKSPLGTSIKKRKCVSRR